LPIDLKGGSMTSDTGIPARFFRPCVRATRCLCRRRQFYINGEVRTTAY